MNFDMSEETEIEEKLNESEKIPHKFSEDKLYEMKSLLARKVVSIPILLGFGTYNYLQANKYCVEYKKIRFIKALYLFPIGLISFGVYTLGKCFLLIREIKKSTSHTNNKTSSFSLFPNKPDQKQNNGKMF